MVRIVREAQILYRQTCPDLRGKVCPGVCRLLRSLVRRGIPAGLVTGNLSRIGWRKMERAGLRRYFRLEHLRSRPDSRRTRRQGCCGGPRQEAGGSEIPWWCSSAITRTTSPRLALNGFLSVAVATGIVPLEELRPHQPDFLVRDLRELDLEQVYALHYDSHCHRL